MFYSEMKSLFVQFLVLYSSESFYFKTEGITQLYVLYSSSGVFTSHTKYLMYH